MIERMIQIMDLYKQVQDTQNKDMFANIIFDLEDINISNIDFDFLKHLIVFFEERYENIINIIYCKNVNLIFRMCYKILRPFISKDLKEKLKFIRKGSTEILDSMPDNESDEEMEGLCQRGLDTECCVFCKVIRVNYHRSSH